VGEKRLAWLLPVLALALTLPASASAKADFGDAPDGASAGYSEPAILGAFPSLAANGGPQHKRVGALVLGVDESAEGDSLQVDGDSGDDGADPQLKACSAKSELRTVINAGGLPKSKAKAGHTFYVNVWFDWNRDGDWADDDDRCAPEWAIENFPVSAAELEDGVLPLAIQFDSGTQVDQLWYRVTLTLDEPVAFEDGGGPAGGYAFGETEDHFIGADPGGGDFSAICKPYPKIMLHGHVGGVNFVYPAKFAKKGSGLTASFVGKVGKGVFRRFKMRGGVPVGIRYAEKRDGPTRLHRQGIKVRFSIHGKPAKTIKCLFVVTHTDPHKLRKKGKKWVAVTVRNRDRWKYWRKSSFRWRKYKRPPRNPGVVLTEVPRDEPESKLYATTVKIKIYRSVLHKYKVKYKQHKYKRMQILFTRYKKFQRGKKLWSTPKSKRKSKLYKHYLKRCKLKALAAGRAHAGRSIGLGGPAVLDCPIAWKAKQSNFSFDLNLNPVDNAPLVIFLQDEKGNWSQPDHAPLIDTTGTPANPPADEQNPAGDNPQPIFVSQADFIFCGSPNLLAGTCADNMPAQSIKFDLTFETQLGGFLIALDASRSLNLLQIQPPLDCTPESSDGPNVLRCKGPIPPGSHISGLFQTNPQLNPCEGLTLTGLAEPGSTAPAPIAAQVAGSSPCP
jgi:GEVED domain